MTQHKECRGCDAPFVTTDEDEDDLCLDCLLEVTAITTKKGEPNDE